jgi:hypothetical protein
MANDNWFKKMKRKMKYGNRGWKPDLGMGY